MMSADRAHRESAGRESRGRANHRHVFEAIRRTLAVEIRQAKLAEFSRV